MNLLVATDNLPNCIYIRPAVLASSKKRTASTKTAASSHVTREVATELADTSNVDIEITTIAKVYDARLGFY